MTTETTVIDIDIDGEGFDLLREHIAGDCFRQIGAHHHMSHEQARRVVQRQSTKLVDRVELDLMVAAK